MLVEIAVITALEGIIGAPFDYMFPCENRNETAMFIGLGVDGRCSDCQQTPCNWSLFGPTIVDCVWATVSSTASVDGVDINKKCWFASYQMYTQGKLGYLGKGNRVLLPPCVVTGVRNNFPDPKHSYVVFLPTTVEY